MARVAGLKTGPANSNTRVERTTKSATKMVSHLLVTLVIVCLGLAPEGISGENPENLPTKEARYLEYDDMPLQNSMGHNGPVCPRCISNVQKMMDKVAQIKLETGWNILHLPQPCKHIPQANVKICGDVIDALRVADEAKIYNPALVCRNSNYCHNADFDSIPEKPDKHHPSHVDPRHPPHVNPRHPHHVDPRHPSHVDPRHPPHVDPRHPHHVDPRHPSHVDPRHPPHVDPRHPHHVDPRHPHHVDPRHPHHVDPRHPHHVDPRHPHHVDPRHPHHVDPRHPHHVDPRHPPHVDPRHPDHENGRDHHHHHHHDDVAVPFEPCDACERAVYHIRKTTRNHTKSEIDWALLNVCRLYPKTKQTECNILVFTHYYDLSNALMQRQPVQHICSKVLRVCKPHPFCSACQLFLENLSDGTDIDPRAVCQDTNYPLMNQCMKELMQKEQSLLQEAETTNITSRKARLDICTKYHFCQRHRFRKNRYLH